MPFRSLFRRSLFRKKPKKTVNPHPEILLKTNLPKPTLQHLLTPVNPVGKRRIAILKGKKLEVAIRNRGPEEGLVGLKKHVENELHVSMNELTNSLGKRAIKHTRQNREMIKYIQGFSNSELIKLMENGANKLIEVSESHDKKRIDVYLDEIAFNTNGKFETKAQQAKLDIQMNQNPVIPKYNGAYYTSEFKKKKVNELPVRLHIISGLQIAISTIALSRGIVLLNSGRNPR